MSKKLFKYRNRQRICYNGGYFIYPSIEMLDQIKKNSTLQLIELFGSIQGETSYSGLPTTFVRLAACNLRCTWCDTTYSFGKGVTWELETIIEDVQKRGHPYVCITGGEPLLQKNVYPLMEQLCDLGFKLTIETGGSLSTASIDPRVATILDVKCPGSGMSEKNDWSNLSRLKPSDEVKFVLADANDYKFAKEICQTYSLYQRERYPLFSPVFGMLDPKELITWMLADQLPVRLNLQIHKFIWDPCTKGV
jgi:7-carboxy-7-deazaguanine synthase